MLLFGLWLFTICWDLDENRYILVYLLNQWCKWLCLVFGQLCCEIFDKNRYYYFDFLVIHLVAGIFGRVKLISGFDLVPFYFFLILFLWQLCSTCSCSAGHLAPISRQPYSSTWSALGACPSWLIDQLLLWICYSEQGVVRLAVVVLLLYYWTIPVQVTTHPLHVMCVLLVSTLHIFN
jgi:hypothetical protein